MCVSSYLTGEVGGILGKHTDSVESIAFCLHPSTPYCVTCGMDSAINVYNMQENSLRQAIQAADYGVFSKVLFSEIDPFFFFASSTLGFVQMIDARNGTIMRTYRGHAAQVNDFVEVKEHNLLVTAGDDFVCNIYDLGKAPEQKKDAQTAVKKTED